MRIARLRSGELWINVADISCVDFADETEVNGDLSMLVVFRSGRELRLPYYPEDLDELQNELDALSEEASA